MNKKKIISYTIDVILVLIIIFLGYVQIAMLVSKNDKKNYGVPRVFGKSFLYVATESMNNPDDPNCLKAGTGIIIEKVTNFDSLKTSNPIYGDSEDPERITDYDLSGDIVTFYLDSVGVPDTHRLIYKNYDEETGVWTFKTMGDNPEAHTFPLKSETWTGDKLIGKVVTWSKGFGTFLTIASPDAAASAGKKAWFFPVAIVTPIVVLAVYYIVDAFVKYNKEEKERQALIEQRMIEAGIDMNDEEAKELFRMKEEIRLEYQEEKERIKKQLRKELEKDKKDEE